MERTELLNRLKFNEREKKEICYFDVWILPKNVDLAEQSELYFDDNAYDIRKLLSEQNIKACLFERKGQNIPVEQLRDAGLILPTLFILSKPEAHILIPIVINIVSNYVYDKFISLGRKDSRVKFIMIKEDERKIIEYDGPAETFEKTVKEILKGY
jgi:hypothetical protein